MVCVSTIVATLCGFLLPLWSSTCMYGANIIGTGFTSCNWLYVVISQIFPNLAATAFSIIEELGVTCPAVGGVSVPPVMIPPIGPGVPIPIS